MSRLPKSRPQRASQRRRTPVAATAKPAAARTAAAGRKPSKRPAAAPARRPAAAKAATAKRPAAAETGKGPSLPRLAVDGATEAVKLPLKVSGRLTLRALDAVARGLRRG
jgi:hypothetical protein